MCVNAKGQFSIRKPIKITKLLHNDFKLLTLLKGNSICLSSIKFFYSYFLLTFYFIYNSIVKRRERHLNPKHFY